MTTGRSKTSDRPPPTSEIPWSGIVVFSVIGGIVLIGILSAAIAGATPKGILTNLGFYVSIAIVFAPTTQLLRLALDAAEALVRIRHLSTQNNCPIPRQFPSSRRPACR